MKVILIHGPPSAGKLTTAKALASRTSFRVLDNHLTFNAARALFDLRDPNHLDLHRALRRTVLEHAARAKLPGLIMTLAYFEPESIPVVAQIQETCARFHGALHGVYLSCEDEELHRRVGQSDRALNGKLTSSARLSELLASHRYIEIPGMDTLSIDVTQRSADETSSIVMKHFGL